MIRYPASYLLLLLLRLLSFLPLRLLYGLSDLLYLLVYHLLCYRKRVVFNNLHNAFPDLDGRQVRTLAGKFYRHFCDQLVETIKLITLPPRKLAGRIEFVNREIIDRCLAEGQSVVVAIGHYGNWEWMSYFATLTGYPMMAVYKYLNNPVFDQLFYRIRARFGTRLVPMKQTLRVLQEYREQETAVICCMIADQCPVRQELDYWTRFLNQDTPVFLGIEKLARRYNYPVLFASVEKTGRGYYRVSLVPVSLDPSRTKPLEITEKHVRLLEERILTKPELWMWSHRRWKFTRRDMDRKKSLSHKGPLSRGEEKY